MSSDTSAKLGPLKVASRLVATITLPSSCKRCLRMLLLSLIDSVTSIGYADWSAYSSFTMPVLSMALIYMLFVSTVCIVEALGERDLLTLRRA